MSKNKPYILGIGFSPRKNGNTDTLLKWALSFARKQRARTKALFVRDLKINPCLGCRYCEEQGECVQKDDFEIFKKELEQADMLVISSPIFFLGVPAQAKAMIDRAQFFWARKYLLDTPAKQSIRPCLLLLAGGSDSPKIFEGAIATIKAFLDVLGFRIAREIKVRAVDEKAQVKEVKGLKERVEKALSKLIASLSRE